jgi:hypothetical protein
MAYAAATGGDRAGAGFQLRGGGESILMGADDSVRHVADRRRA